MYFVINTTLPINVNIFLALVCDKIWWNTIGACGWRFGRLGLLRSRMSHWGGWLEGWRQHIHCEIQRHWDLEDDGHYYHDQYWGMFACCWSHHQPYRHGLFYGLIYKLASCHWLIAYNSLIVPTPLSQCSTNSGITN